MKLFEKFTETGVYPFEITQILGGWLFYRAKGTHGGHTRVLTVRVHCWNTGPEGWSNSQSFQLGKLAALIQNDTQGQTLKHCQPAGWSIRFCRFQFSAAFKPVNIYTS